MDLFVSPIGKDNWNGHLPEPNKDGTDGPLATVQEAILRVRQLRNQNLLTGIATVTLRKGTYTLLKPVGFTHRDHDIVFQAAEGETVKLSGGTRISQWESSKINGRTCWVADVSHELEYTADPRSLYVNDAPRPRSRWPKADWLVMADVPDIGPEHFSLFDGSSRFAVKEGDFDPKWRNPRDIQAVVSHLWTEERMPVASYDPQTREIRSTHSSIFCLRNKDWMDTVPCARYYWENVYEALLEPGEWYLDRDRKKLFYLPKAGETFNNTRVVLPHLLQIIRLHGDFEKREPVRNIRFEGITFTHTDWTNSEGFGKWWDPGEDPSKWKFKDSFRSFIENGEIKMRSSPRPEGTRFAGMVQAAHDLPGAISLEYAEGCSFAECRFSCLGLYAIDVRFACRELAFTGNTIEKIGGGGIKADGSDAFGDPLKRTSHINISDNRIRDCGLVFAPAVGIGLIHSGKNRVEHNEISNLYYTGISVGWVWSFDENVSTENYIAHNHIHNIGQRRLSDMGGIYTLGRQPGTILLGNHIHDVYGTHYGGWGIYLDQGSSFIRVEGNLVYRTGSQGLHEHWGRQNVYLDNIFALSDQSGVIFAREEKDGSIPYPPKGSLFMRNVVLSMNKGAFKDFMTYLDAGLLQSDLNLYWDIHDKKKAVIWDYDPWPDLGLEKRQLGLEETRTHGNDLHSQVADPLFSDPENGDFSVPPESPAHHMGIRVPDASKAGVRPKEERKIPLYTTFRKSEEMVFGD